MQFLMQFTVVVVMESVGRERFHALYTLPHPVIHCIPSNPIPISLINRTRVLHPSKMASFFGKDTSLIFIFILSFVVYTEKKGNFSRCGIIYILEKGFEKDKSSWAYQDFGFIMICWSCYLGTEEYEKWRFQRKDDYTGKIPKLGAGADPNTLHSFSPIQEAKNCLSFFNWYNWGDSQIAGEGGSVVWEYIFV